MGLKNKLYLAFGSILGLLVFFLGSAMFLIYQLDDNINQVIKDRYEKVRLAMTIERRILFIDGELKNLIITTDNNKIESMLGEIAEYQGQQKVAFETYVRSSNNPRVVEILPKLKITLDNYEQLVGDVIHLTKTGRRAEAARLLMSDGQRILGQAKAFTRELKAMQERSMADILEQSTGTSNLAQIMLAVCIITSLVGGGLIAVRVVHSITYDLKRFAQVIGSVRNANTEILPRIDRYSQDEIGRIAVAFNEMAAALEWHRKQEKEAAILVEQKNRLKTQLAEMSTMLQGVNDLATLGRVFLAKLISTLAACYGVFYLAESQDDKPVLTKVASYADTGDQLGVAKLRIGEGITGQCAAQNQSVILEQVPPGYIKIASGLGSSKPDYVAVFPVAFENKVLAVVEIAGFGRLTDEHTEYIKQVMDNVAIILMRVTSQMQVEHLLAESQAFAEEMQSQSEEMQLQQEELRIINERLEEQCINSEQKTQELEQAKAVLEEQARQLDISSRYKSEFLANMSHELRTPLNSLLILAQMLEANPDRNLTAKQLEYAHAIHSAGSDLLLLINDILDLSKLNSGKLSISFEAVAITPFATELVNQFTPIAESKGLIFDIDIHQEVPATFYTDGLRLQQILKNLLSNAFKFTEKGLVSFRVKTAANQEWLMFEVSDTGIGISPDKQAVIFEAFHQADGTTSRKYGGTGLGLSISRELSKLLGGYINLESREGDGSTFTLYLPVHKNNNIDKTADCQDKEVVAAIPEENSQKVQLETVKPPVLRVTGNENALNGKKVLIVDDDMRNVYALVAAMEAKGITALFAQNGREGFDCLTTNEDIDLVIMDIMMPEMDGYQAIQAIRKLPAFHDLPIIALTAKAMKQDRDRCIEAGASDYLCKPVQLEQLLSLMRVWLYR